MIQAKDFKIGNWIADYECEPYYFQIEEIRKNEQGKLAVYYRNGSCISLEPEPIQLTEEWLLKFGFEKRNESDNFYKYGIGENILTKDWILLIKYFKDENKFFYQNGYHTIKYLHELQNLYFALTNQELEIKEI